MPLTPEEKETRRVERNRLANERYQNDPEYRARILNRAANQREKRREYQRAYYHEWKVKNPEKLTTAWRKAHEADPLGRKLNKRESNLRIKYGITQAQYQEKLNSQGHVCAICGYPQRGKYEGTALSVDHDGITKQVRGLLCRECNMGIGQLNHDVVLLKNAIAYLRLYNLT